MPLRVRFKQTGQVGSIPDDKFDPALFEQVEAPAAQAPVGISVDSAVQPPTPPVPQKTMLNKIGDLAMGAGTVFSDAAARLGDGVGAAAASVATQGQTNQIQDQYRETSQRYTDKSIELAKSGREAEAMQLRTLAQETLDKANTESDARLAQSDKGMEDVIKGGVGTAAMFVPGGKAGAGAIPLASRVASTTLAGAGAGYGSSQKDDELSSTIGGGIVGAGAGLAGELYGVVAGKLSARKAANMPKPGSELNETVINPQVKASPFYLSNKEKLMETASVAGIKPGDPPKIGLKKMEDAFIKSDGQIKGLLAQAPPLGQETVLDTLIKNLDNTDFTPGDATYEKLLKTQLSKVEKLGTEIPPSEIYQMKSDIGDTLSPVFKKLEKGNPLTKSEEVRVSMYYALKDSLDTVSTQVGELNGFQHDIFTLSEGLVESLESSKNLKFKLPMGGDIPLPITSQRVRATGQSMRNGAGTLLNNTGMGIDTALSAGGTIGRNTATTMVASALNNPSETPDDSINQPGQGDESQTNQSDVPNQNQDIHDQSISQESSTYTGFTVAQLVDARKKAYADGNGEAVRELEDLYKDEVSYQKTQASGAGKGLTTSAAGQLGELESSYKMADTLPALVEKYQGKMGPLAGGVNAMNPYDTDAQTFQSQMKLTAQVIGKALEGGVLRKEDEAKYEKILPQIGDTPDVARKKIGNVKALLKQKYSTMKTNYEGASPDSLNTGMGVDSALQQY